MEDQQLKKQYEESIVPELMKELGIKNKLAVPRVTKIVVNMGIGDVFRDKGNLEKAQKEMSVITGQMPSVRSAKISVAGFNLRRGMPVGLKVTLRGRRMYDFLQRLIAIVLPRLRDFRGVPLKSFDKSGNYTLGIAEHTVFPEVDITKSSPHGLEVTIVTSSKNVEEAKKLLTLMGMPFEKEEEK